ncbi:protein NO VEIN domain-containing protein [Amycolatopsis methanolica]|uniref:protein NO VEIN domain-containing protein n=1 Tax=Amycolatopsis methanolica TaxID=1814 RepID=UPI00344889E9
MEWLKDHGLLSADGTRSSIRALLFEAAVVESLWFRDADSLISSPEALPDDALRAADALGLAPEAAHAVIRAAWGRVDTAERARLGSAGEQALVQLLSSISGVSVVHVAKESDGFGYDIQLTMEACALHLEVKTTTRRGNLRIYLSRNEYETMLHDGAWTLVAVRLTEELKIAALASIKRCWVQDAAPLDRGLGSRWESVRLDVPPDALTPGVPSLVEVLPPPLDPLLTGQPAWPG